MMKEDPQACIRQQMLKVRRRLGLTQDQVAQTLGVSRITYHRMERGGKRITLPEIAALCEMFDCSVMELVDDPIAASAYKNAARSILGQVHTDLR